MRTVAVLIAVALLPGIASAGAGLQAAADDLASARDTAQAVADEVTSLERRLAGLRSEQEQLQSKVGRLEADLSQLEGLIHDYDLAVAAARERFVARAVEAYKSGPATDLDVLLSTESMTELASVAQTMSHTAELDDASLEELVAARGRASEAQEELVEEGTIFLQPSRRPTRWASRSKRISFTARSGWRS